MKILIIGCVYLGEGYLAAANGLRALGHEIAFFPHACYVRENVPIEELARLINGEKTTRRYPGRYPSPDTPANLVLWWVKDNLMSPESVAYIRNNTAAIHVNIIWDPHLDIDLEQDLKNKANLYHHMLLCDPRAILKYRNYHHSVNYFWMGYDSNMTRHVEDASYTCDVSIAITNMYECDKWSTQKVKRTDIMNALYECPDLNVNLYGPDRIGKLYPKIYKGFVSYKNNHKLFSNSKVNLNITPLSNVASTVVDGELRHFIPERLTRVLASKGLLMSECDYSGFLEHGVDYIKIDNVEDAIISIKDVSLNTEKYDAMRQRGYDKIKLMTWENTWKLVHNLIPECKLNVRDSGTSLEHTT